MASDPWEDEAKQFKAAPQQASAPAAPSAPNEDWKVWQQQGNTESAQPGIGKQIQGAFDTAVTPKLHSADQGIMGNIGTGALNIGKGALSLATPLVHPLQSIGASPLKNPAHPIEGFAGPDPLTEMGKGIAAHPIESAEQLGGQMLGGKVIGAGISGAKSLADPLRAYRSPLIPQNEAIARSAADIIKPNPRDYPQMVRNMSERLPEAREFLQRSGINNPSSPLEFGKAATGAGQELSRGNFQKNFIEPLADSPAGGSTVGKIYGQVRDINDRLSAIYRSPTIGETLTKEAADPIKELEAQRDKLNGVLYKTLSERTGVPVEEIQKLNQAGAQLQHIGDVTDAAQTVRRMGMNYAPGGGLSRMGILERIGRGAESLIGGPERVAGYRLGRVLSRVQEPAMAAPNPEEVANNRTNYAIQESDAAAANRAASGARKPEGMGPTPRGGPPPITPEAEPAWLQAGRKQAGRAAVISEREATARAEKLVQSQREQELLSKARQQQSAARKTKP